MYLLGLVLETAAHLLMLFIPCYSRTQTGLRSRKQLKTESRGVRLFIALIIITSPHNWMSAECFLLQNSKHTPEERDLYHDFVLFYFLVFPHLKQKIKATWPLVFIWPNTRTANGVRACVPACMSLCERVWMVRHYIFKGVTVCQVTGYVISRVKLIDLVVWTRVSRRLLTLVTLRLWAVMDVSESSLHKPTEKPTEPCEPQWTCGTFYIGVIVRFHRAANNQTHHLFHHHLQPQKACYWLNKFVE